MKNNDLLPHINLLACKDRMYENRFYLIRLNKDIWLTKCRAGHLEIKFYSRLTLKSESYA